MQSVRSTGARTDTSYLFLVRLWRGEPASEGSEEREWESWKGKVQHVRSGQMHGVDSLAALAEAIQALLSDLKPESADITADSERYRSE